MSSSSSSSSSPLEAAQKLLSEWKASLQTALGTAAEQQQQQQQQQGGGGSTTTTDLLRHVMEQGLAETTARVEKVKQAGEMRRQVENLPEGVVKDHMSKALAELEGELGGGSSGSGGGGQKKDAVASGGSSSTGSTTSSSTTGSRPPPTAPPAATGDATFVAVADRVAQAAGNVHVKGAKDALALAIHAIMLEEGFTCYAAEEEKGGPTGFAPPVRAVPMSRLVPANWNADPGNVCLNYRHDRLKGREVTLKVLWMDEERVLVELQDPSSSTTGGGGGSGGSGNGGPATVTLNARDYVKESEAVGGGDAGNSDPLASLRGALDGLRASIRVGLLQTFLPMPSTSTSATATSATGGEEAYPTGPGAPFQGGQAPFSIPVPNPLGPMVPPPSYGYGGRTGGLVPDFEGDLQPGGGWGGPGGGNLMGPNHPMFTGQDRHGRGGGGGGGGLMPGMGGMGGGGLGGGGVGMPQPRFDPFGPVIPPTRGGPPARGPIDPNDPRGRGQAFRQPDPDHLPPPGPAGGGNFYF